MPGRPLALVDMDGTLADFDGAMRAELARIHGESEPEALVETRYEETHPFMKERRRLVKRLPGFWRNLRRLPLGFAIVEELQRQAFELHVLTKAPRDNPMAWQEKVAWCQEHLPGVPITISDDKSLVYGKVLVDDWPDYFTRWMEHRPRGLVVVPAQAWNAEWQNTERLLRYRGDEDRPELARRLAAIRATMQEQEG